MWDGVIEILRSKAFSVFLPIFSSLLSSFLLVLAFPKYDLYLLVWVGLVPLLIAIQGRSPIFGFLLCLICGVAFFTGIFLWMFEVPGYRFLHHIFIGFYLGPLFGLFGLAFNFIARRWGITRAALTAPFLWVSLEFIRSNLGFLTLPWALLGHSQYQCPPIIQLSSVTGAYGVSFLIVMVNSALTALILAFFPKLARYKPVPLFRLSRGATISIVLGTAVLTGLVVTYGHTILRKPVSEETVKTSLLQGNIDRVMKTNPRKHASFIMQKYADLTRKAVRDQPRLIVWPEAATPGFVLKNITLLTQLTSLVRETGTHFLIGSSEYPKFEKDYSPGPKGTGNTALFFSPKGKVLGQYLKIHLVPFGEYIPLEGIITWPRFIVPEGKRSFDVPGKQLTLFEVDGAKFGTIICWEIVFPDLFRQFVNNGANFMLNITNEGWFGEAALYQMLAISVFRAVENRISVARAANTGISCFIDPCGRIIAKVKNGSRDTLVEGYITRGIPLSRQRTFYTRHGDVFAYVSLFITGIVMALTFLRRKGDHSVVSSPRAKTR
jgi:apolipoprotein N-acyltransferase